MSRNTGVPWSVNPLSAECCHENGRGIRTRAPQVRNVLQAIEQAAALHTSVTGGRDEQ